MKNIISITLLCCIVFVLLGSKKSFDSFSKKKSTQTNQNTDSLIKKDFILVESFTNEFYDTSSTNPNTGVADAAWDQVPLNASIAFITQIDGYWKNSIKNALYPLVIVNGIDTIPV